MVIQILARQRYLTSLLAHVSVGNWAGVTVERKEGQFPPPIIRSRWWTCPAPIL
ncbi:hypothetical protein DMH88_03320 [Escherichia coli]|nr:hypothetical protein [Escherichia coli]